MLRNLKEADEQLFQFLKLESAYRFFAKHCYLIFYIFMLSLVVYGYDLFSFSLKIDSENHAFSPGAKVQWLMQGRWGMYYLNAFLLPDAIMPFIPVLIGISGLSFGVLFLLLTLSDQRGIPDFLAAPMAVGCPLLAFSFYFTTLGYGLGVAIAVVSVGIYALTRWRWSGAAVAILLFAFGIGIYQAIILLLPVCFGFYLVVRVIAVPGISVKWLLGRCAIFCAVMLLAYGLFESIKLYTLHTYHLEYDQGYLQQYLHFSMDRKYLSVTIPAVFHAAAAYYTGDESYYLYPLTVLAVLFSGSLFFTVFHLLVARQVWSVKLLALLVLFGSLAVPMGLHLFNAGDAPPRTMVAIPFVLAGVVFAATSCHSKMLKLVLGVLVASCFFKFAVVNNRYALSSQMSWKADQDLSLLIVQRIHQIWQKLPDYPPPYPVEVVGELQRMESPLYVHRDAIGASFYSWDGGSAERITRLWASMRQFDFRMATPVEQQLVSTQAFAMPIWPAAGSVDVVNGVIVVKMAEYPQYRIDALCGSSGALCRFRQPH